MTSTLTRKRALGLIATTTGLLAPAGVRAQATRIRVSTLPTGDTYAFAFYARDGGFFSKAGLNVDVLPVNEPSSIMAGVAGNSIDVGFVDPPLLANAYNRGLPLAYFGGGGLYSSEAPTTVLCTSPTTSLKTARDLHGKTVAVIVVASIGAAAIRAWLTANGADPDQVKIIEMPFTTMVTAVEKGDLAAAFLGEPYLTQALQTNRIKVWAKPFDAIGPKFFINACFSTRGWITSNPELAAKMSQALSETARWANSHHDDTAVILAKYGKVPVEVVRAMNRVRYADYDPKLIQPVLDTAIKYKLVAQAVTAADLTLKVPGL